jgi:AcrR family transcriptional regulator
LSVPDENRERLIAAMAASVEERGYAETTVADVVRLARTSRRTFYEHFQDRADCFLALFDVTNDQMFAALAAAVDPSAPWERQVDQALGAYLDAVVSRPALFRSFVRELPALGERGAAHQLAAIERFARQLVDLVEQVRREQGGLGAGPLGLDQAIMIVGGVRELMVIAAQQGRDLRELRPAIGSAVNAIVGGAVVRS